MSNWLARFFGRPSAKVEEPVVPEVTKGIEREGWVEQVNEIDLVIDDQNALITPERWLAIGESVTGASHGRTGTPNQDFIAWAPTDQAHERCVVALADGHGSPKSFRSHLGSKIAVRVALKIMNDFWDLLDRELDHSILKDATEEELPKSIMRAWRRQVESDLDLHPFTASELEKLKETSGENALSQIHANSCLAYGSTLITAMVSPNCLLCLQLGDGDILVVDDTGNVIRPIDRDERHIANETTSLSAADCWRDFRSYFRFGPESSPSLILACTDGYSNAFATEEGFLSAGKDFLDLLKQVGIKGISQELKTWLEDTSRTGSGDDVTLGILVRESALSHSQSENPRTQTIQEINQSPSPTAHGKSK